MTNEALLQQYESLKDGCGIVELNNWTLLELSGADRKKFLHNFCTADTKGLEDGTTTEAFVLNGKGKTLGHVHLVALPERLLLVGPGHQAPALTEHLDKYIIREDVSIKNLTDETKFLFLGGEKSAAVLDDVFHLKMEPGQANVYKHLSGNKFDVFRGEIAGPGYLFLVSASNYADASAEILGRCDECSPEVLNAVRLEHGTPWFGFEINDSCLPQEVDRDEKTINFNKGCYLGQETVARIDALGRVNRLLRFAKLPGSAPSLGEEIKAGNMVTGTVLSSAEIPGSGESILSSIVKRSASAQDTELAIGDRTASVL